MDNKLSVVKNGLQEILKKKYEERDAQMAMELINEYEGTLSRLERMRPFIERLENGEEAQTVVNEFYNLRSGGLENSENKVSAFRNGY